jgi:hypothetical protein
MHSSVLIKGDVLISGMSRLIEGFHCIWNRSRGHFQTINFWGKLAPGGQSHDA